jgi:CRP-like cAMP-binding protein
MRERSLNVLGRNHLLDLLPRKDRKRLLPAMERVAGKHGDVLSKRQKTISERVECGTIGNEGMVGLPLLHGVGVSALEVFFQVPGEAMRLPATAFAEEVARNGALARLAHRYAEAFCGLLAQSTACNNIHAVEQRFSRLILMSHDRVGSDTIQLTQGFLAEMLGVRRSSVSPVASILQRDGLIRYKRGVIVVLKRRELEARSCECYVAVRKEFERLLS